MIRVDVFDQNNLLIFRGFIEAGSMLRFGRSTENNIVLPDLGVSRECGKIELDPNGNLLFYIKDQILPKQKSNEYIVHNFKFKITDYGHIDFDLTQNKILINDNRWYFLTGFVSLLVAGVIGLLSSVVLNYNPNAKATIGWVSGWCIGFAMSWLAMSVISKSVNGQYKWPGFFCYGSLAVLGISISEFDFFYASWIFGRHELLNYSLNILMTAFWAWLLFSIVRLIFDHAKTWVIAGFIATLFGLVSLSSALKHVDIGESFEWKAADRAPILYPIFQEAAITQDQFLKSIDEIAQETSDVAKKYTDDDL